MPSAGLPSTVKWPGRNYVGWGWANNRRARIEWSVRGSCVGACSPRRRSDRIHLLCCNAPALRVADSVISACDAQSRPAIQWIDLGPRDRLLDAVEVIVKQFLSLRAGDVRRTAIDPCHGNLCSHERAHGSGGIFVFGDGHGWLLPRFLDRRKAILFLA